MITEQFRILVAEDNPAMSRVLQFTLQRAGFAVMTAANGQLALEQLCDQWFDAVITDHQMPLMSGVELCTHLRSLPQYAETPVVLLTAKGLELDRQVWKDELQISACLAKPFSPSHVLRTLEDLLAGAPDRQRIQRAAFAQS